MVVMTTAARAEGLTREDLDAMPDDGRRYELIDGVVVVSAAPSRRHQAIALSLAITLKGRCPASMQVLPAPFDVVLAEAVVIEPDLLVARRSDLTERDLPAVPVLAVEVHSPSTRWIDLGAKMERLAEAGCPSYWVVEPGGGQVGPSLTAFGLDGHGYVEVARLSGDETWTAQRPFPVTIVPNQLLDD